MNYSVYGKAFYNIEYIKTSKCLFYNLACIIFRKADVLHTDLYFR